jgi:hypothetical protein
MSRSVDRARDPRRVLARLQRAEAEIEQDRDDQQAARQHHVRADEQAALAAASHSFMDAPSSADFPGVGHQ